MKLYRIVVAVALSSGYALGALAQQPNAGPGLTAEQARSALIEVIKNARSAEIRGTLSEVRNAKIIPSRGSGDRLEIGRWTIHPKERRVNLKLGGSPDDFHFKGTLERSDDGKWRISRLEREYISALPQPK